MPNDLPSIDLFGIRIHRVNMSQAVEAIFGWLNQPAGACRYVVTPNVDHVVMLQDSAPLREAYAQASLILADGFPIVWASRWFGKTLPQRVAGSDLIPALFQSTTEERPLRVFWLGAAPDVARRAGEVASKRWPHVNTVGWDSPPLGFERSPQESERIVAMIDAAHPDLLVVGLGAPKQELWVHRHRERLTAKVAVCAGATIDFVAGARRRAPYWMRCCGLEWFHRAISEPRRLVKRYLRDAWVFPQILWRQSRLSRT